MPLAKAVAGKYHKEMVELISSFLGVLKNTPKNTNEDTAPILKVVMTGCLKVAKNSIFTGVNNVVVNTVLNTQTKFTSIIGFNKEETKKVLEDYNLSDYEWMSKKTMMDTDSIMKRCSVHGMLSTSLQKTMSIN